jgi:hypothetical protein
MQELWAVLPGTTLGGIHPPPLVFSGPLGDVERSVMALAKERHPTFRHWRVDQEAPGRSCVVGKIEAGDVVENTALWLIYAVVPRAAGRGA